MDVMFVLLSLILQKNKRWQEESRAQARGQRDQGKRESYRYIQFVLGFCWFNYILFIDNYNLFAVARPRSQNQVIVLPYVTCNNK